MSFSTLLFRLRRLSGAAALAVLGSCALLEFSPSAISGAKNQTNLTAKNLARLAAPGVVTPSVLVLQRIGRSSPFVRAHLIAVS